MNKQQAWLFKAAVDLGLRVEAGLPIVLPSGQRVVPEAFFPDLGWNGIMVFSSSLGPETIKEVLRAGYPGSFFGDPHESEEYEVDGYAEMFSDWGWCGPAVNRPEWMDRFER